MQTTIELQQNVCFKATSGSGHSILMDGPPEFGGEDLGARPMETLLAGMGGCASFDVVHILRKRRLTVTGCTAQIDALRAETDPKVFVKIHLIFVFLVARIRISHRSRKRGRILEVCATHVHIRSTIRA